MRDVRRRSRPWPTCADLVVEASEMAVATPAAPRPAGASLRPGHKARQSGFHGYAYLFIGGLHVSVRLGEDDRLCLLVVIGVRDDGVKELLTVEDDYRESTDSCAPHDVQKVISLPQSSCCWSIPADQLTWGGPHGH